MTRPPLLSLDDALPQLLAQAHALTGVQSVSTFDADGRVLAQDVTAALQVPPQDNSSMDGYAVRVADCAQTGAVLRVTQRIPAGTHGRSSMLAKLHVSSQVRPFRLVLMLWSCRRTAKP